MLIVECFTYWCQNVNIKNSIGVLLLLVSAQSALSETYEMSVTRKDNQIYKVDGKDVVIQTRYCYAYVYSQDAILKSNGYGGGDLIFMDGTCKCDVKAIFGMSTLNAGDYKVTVSRDDDDWYEVFGADTYIKTSSCLSLALGEDATLSISAGNVGSLTFSNGEHCMVEGVYSKIKP